MNNKVKKLYENLDGIYKDYSGDGDTNNYTEFDATNLSIIKF